MKRYLISFYYIQNGGSSRLGEYLGDRTGWNNLIWECENLPQNNLELQILEKELSKRMVEVRSLRIIAISPLQ
jgi:hypothetical protein